MFCINCGNKLDDNDIFCSACGAKVGQEEVMVNQVSRPSNEVIFETRPTYRFMYIALPKIIEALTRIIPFAFIVILMITSLKETFSDSIIMEHITPVILLLIAIPVGSVIYLIIKILLEKKQYDKITYTFYIDKVVFRDDFLDISEKELKYAHIKEIVKKQTFVQRWFNIGSIVLYSNAESGYASGIALVNVENIDEVYRKIKEITHI